jgi:hypothetical protein
MLDASHKLTLRGVAQGMDLDSPALRTLVAGGLVEQRPDGSHVLTPAGELALEDDRSGELAWSDVTWPVPIGILVALTIVLAAVNAIGGDRLLTDTEIVALPTVGVLVLLFVVYARRRARRET